MAKKSVRNPERSFGVSVGGVLVAIALALVWRGRLGRAEAVGGLGLALLIPGLVYPRILALPSAWWWRFARALGYVNARILLTILFAVIFVPVSMIWRLTGKAPLARRRSRWTGWSPAPTSHHDPAHYARMY